MTRNKEFADMMAQSAEMQAGASKDYQNQSKDLIKREQEEASKPKEGGLKETQIAFMEAEMKVQSAFDALVKIVAEYVNPAFTNLMKGLDEFTSGLIKKFADWGVVPADFDQFTFEEGIRVGVKWQQEQDKKLYSVEEVLNLLNDCRGENPIDISKWFEQFKK